MSLMDYTVTSFLDWWENTLVKSREPSVPFNVLLQVTLAYYSPSPFSRRKTYM